jgi:hypothetical protein
MATLFPLDPEVNELYQGYYWDGNVWKKSGEDAGFGYLEEAVLQSTYLTQSSASVTYATQTDLNNIDALPSQSGNSGKYLTTSGSAASWGTLDLSLYLTQSSASTTYARSASAAFTGTMVSAGNINPSATNTYDLGTTSLRWRNIYTQDLHLSNGIGDYTVVEGKEDLFLVNNKSGKSFKFALIEVDSSEVPPKSESS